MTTYEKWRVALVVVQILIAVYALNHVNGQMKINSIKYESKEVSSGN